jgi:hypothetical protein
MPLIFRVNNLLPAVPRPTLLRAATRYKTASTRPSCFASSAATYQFDGTRFITSSR